MNEEIKEKTSFSILERFRQLSKEKEKEQTSVTKTPESVNAVYLNNCDPGMSSPNEKRRWSNYNKGGRGGRGTKRKFDGDNNVPEWKIRRAQERHNIGAHVGLKAEDVGINGYISTCPGFSGIIKQRFSDFQVNEISEDGVLIKLTSQKLPENPVPKKVDIADISEINDSNLLKILPKEKWDELYTIVKNENHEDSVNIEVTDVSKEERLKIHEAIRNIFKNKVISNTVEEEDGRKVLKITCIKDGSQKGRLRSSWKMKEYLHFVLHKENMDVTDAVNLLSHKLHVRGNDIKYCGTKDKRAKTTQSACVKRVSADRLNKLILKNVVTGNYEYKRYSLRLGQLRGNRFRIAVRNIDNADEIVAEAIESLKTKGFLNYFGMQRFGASVIVPTYKVGIALLHKEWKEAVELLLKPRPGERCFPEVAEGRKVWWETRDAKKALKCFHWKTTCLEAKVLQGLDKSGGTGYLNALENLPRNTVMFYCHAYQSLIWNKIISRRVKEFGLTPLPGDIVLLETDNKDTTISNCNDKADSMEIESTDKKQEDSDESENKVGDNDDSDNESNAEEDGRKSDESKSADTLQTQIDEFTAESSRWSKIKYLTEEDAKEANIEDVIYPLPGYNINYPKNVVAGWYNEFLKEDDLSLSMLEEFKPYAHIFSMCGTYRKMIEKPDNTSWSILKYSDENADLLISDFDEMNGVKPIESCSG
ncbi:pseudouridine synthase 7 isoform X2 [Lycorma delicatula]|uniref:pseudouridine synthase 7 isoform X2 n=1 Tax=Lycorma delicatula TaxID=130591 RepID=UPI003F513BBD